MLYPQHLFFLHFQPFVKKKYIVTEMRTMI